jgi:type II secretion system protein L
MANTISVIKTPPQAYHTVLIRILDKQGVHGQCFFYEDSGEVVCLPLGAIVTLPALKEEAQYVVVIPGECIRFTALSLPAQYSAKQLPSIVKYALEEELLTDVDDNHFVIFKNTMTTEKVCVGVIEKTVLQNFLDVLEKQSIKPDVVCSEADFLQSPFDNTWQIAATQDSVMVKTTQYMVGIMPIAQSSLYFDTLRKESGEPEAIDLMVIDEPLDSRLDNVLMMFDGVKINRTSWVQRMQAASFLQEIASRNLLQGVFQPKKKMTKQKRFWRASMVLLACAGFFIGVQQFWSYVAWHHLSSVYQTKIEAIYFQQFPDAKTVIEPKVRFDRVIQSLASSGQTEIFWSLLSKLSQAMPREKDMIILQSLTYEKDKLSVQIIAKNSQALETFLAYLARQGSTVKEEKVLTTGDSVNATLVLS